MAISMVRLRWQMKIQNYIYLCEYLSLKIGIPHVYLEHTEIGFYSELEFCWVFLYFTLFGVNTFYSSIYFLMEIPA